MDIYEINKKLLGPIYAVGETNEDKVRLENLKNTINLVDQLLDDIYDASGTKDRAEDSMKRIGQYADRYLEGVHEWLEEVPQK